MAARKTITLAESYFNECMFTFLCLLVDPTDDLRLKGRTQNYKESSYSLENTQLNMEQMVCRC